MTRQSHTTALDDAASIPPYLPPRGKPGCKLTRSAYLATLDKALANARGQRVVNTGIKRVGETVDEFRRRMRVEWKGRMR